MTDYKLTLDICEDEYAYLRVKARQMNCVDARDFVQRLVESFIVLAMEADGVPVPMDEEDDDECALPHPELDLDFDDGIPF